MSVVNQMLRDLEQSQTVDHLNLKPEPIIDEHSVDRSYFQLAGMACLIMILIAVTYIIYQQFSEASSEAYQTSALNTKTQSSLIVTPGAEEVPVEKSSLNNKLVKTSEVKSKDVTLGEPTQKSLSVERVSTANTLSKQKRLDKKSVDRVSSSIITSEKNSISQLNSIKNTASVKPRDFKKAAVKETTLKQTTTKQPVTNTKRTVVVSNRQGSSNNASVNDSQWLTAKETVAPLKSRSKTQQFNERLKIAERAVDQKLFSAAIEQLKLLLKDNQESHRSRELLAYSYMQTEQVSNLEYLLQSAILTYPEHRNYRSLLARQYVQQQDWKKVVTLIGATPVIHRSSSLLIMQAIAHQKLQQHQPAIDVYGELLKSNSSRGEWWIGLAVSLESVSRFQDAYKALLKASEDPRLTQQQNSYIQQKVTQLKGSL